MKAPFTVHQHIQSNLDKLGDTLVAYLKLIRNSSSVLAAVFHETTKRHDIQKQIDRLTGELGVYKIPATNIAYQVGEIVKSAQSQNFNTENLQAALPNMQAIQEKSFVVQAVYPFERMRIARKHLCDKPL